MTPEQLKAVKQWRGDMSDTPRTDEFAKRCRDEYPVTGDGRCLEFARQLERELNGAMARCDEALKYAESALSDLRNSEVEEALLIVERDQLRRALEESVNLQSHYATLLNARDGGERMTFTADSWIKRLAEIKKGLGRL